MAVGIFVIAAIALQGSTITTASTLDEIIQNEDCLGLEAWEEVHTFDDVNISKELPSLCAISDNVSGGRENEN
jgi:hypothetical protein